MAKRYAYQLVPIVDKQGRFLEWGWVASNWNDPKNTWRSNKKWLSSDEEAAKPTEKDDVQITQ